MLPMDLAWRLLKEARPHALIPNFDLLHMLNPKSDIQEQLISQHVPHALSNAESATEVYNQLLEEYKIREEETDYFPLPQTQIEDYGEQHPPTFRYNATKEVTYSPDFQDIHTGEPMSIGDVLLKERVSPEAKRHKLEYDKKYESSPERVKYREELNRERRRRHIMGRGGPDMSHTKDHTIVPESPHTNRARHFKDKGTLL